MSQTMHIMRKDLRRLRWLLALGLAALVARTLLVVNSAAAVDSVATGLLMQQMWGTLAVVELLLMAVIGARLVHEEPLVGLTPFWLTRPYGVGNLLGAKLLVAAAFLIALPVIADLVTTSRFDAGPRALAATAATAALGYGSWMLLLMLLATLTPSLGTFVLTIVGVVAAASMLMATLLGVAEIRSAMRTEIPTYTPPGAPDATRSVVMIATYVCATFAVIVYQYRHRRWRRAAALAIVGLAATVVVPMLWPWSFARGEQIPPDAWASTVVVRHDPAWGTQATDVVNVSRRMREAWRRLNAHVVVEGLPPQVTVQWAGIRSRLQFPDGTAVESSQSAGFADAFNARSAEAALGARILAAPEFFKTQRERWTPMLTITEQELVRRRGRSGRLEANIDVFGTEMRAVGTLRLTPGVSLAQRVAGLEIVSVQRGPDSRNVVVRRWRTTSPISLAPAPQQYFALRRRSSSEALMGGVENRWQVGGRPTVVVALLGIPFGFAGWGSGGFSVETMHLRFPGRGYGEPSSLDPSWFDDAELVVLETKPAGFVSRRLTIDPFEVPAT